MPTVLASAGTRGHPKRGVGGGGREGIVHGDFQLIFIASSAAHMSEKLAIGRDDHADSAARAPGLCRACAPRLRRRLRRRLRCPRRRPRRPRRRPRALPTLPPTPPHAACAACAAAHAADSIGRKLSKYASATQRRVFIDRFRANQRKGNALNRL